MPREGPAPPAARVTGFEVRLLLLTAAGAALSTALLATGWWLWNHNKD